MREETVRLPRTGTRRNQLGYCKLLYAVRPNAASGLDFQGDLFRAGAQIPLTRLWPDERYPAQPVLLESAQLEFSGRGHTGNPLVFILWLFDPDAREWQEIARRSARGNDWVIDLAPIAQRLMTSKVREPDFGEIATRIRDLLAAELEPLECEQRVQVLSRLHDHLASAIVAPENLMQNLKEFL